MHKFHKAAGEAHRLENGIPGIFDSFLFAFI